MMHYAVYWQPGDEMIECAFFGTEEAARGKVASLIADADGCADDGRIPDWDITLLRVIGEVRQIPMGDGGYALVEVKEK